MTKLKKIVYTITILLSLLATYINYQTYLKIQETRHRLEAING